MNVQCMHICGIHERTLKELSIIAQPANLIHVMYVQFVGYCTQASLLDLREAIYSEVIIGASRRSLDLLECNNQLTL